MENGMYGKLENNIYGKLQIIQQELVAPKNLYNGFGKYNYRSCESILEAVKPLLQKLDLILILRDDIVQVGDRIYIKATAYLQDIKSGQVVENTAFAREEEKKAGMDGSQITGASSSYARKYALNGLFAIDDVKDSDSTNTHGNAESSHTEPINELETAMNYAFSKGNNTKKFKDYTMDELLHVREWAESKGNTKVSNYAQLVIDDRNREDKAPWEE